MAPRSASQRGNDMASFGGQKDARQTKAEDETGHDGTRDDDSAGTGRAPDPHETDGGAGDNGEQQRQAPPEPKGPPSDDVRNRIFAKMRNRNAEQDDDGAAGGDEGDGAAGGADDGATGGDKPAGETGADPDPNLLSLEVDGKKVSKSLEEIAVLTDLSVDEIKAKPQFATRLAQRELASQDRLERSKKLYREARSRETDDEVDPPRRPAQNQGENDGSKDDATDQQPGSRKTNGLEEAAQKLVEDIQIGDPKEAAGKLVAFLDQVVSTNVSSHTSETRQSEAIAADRDQTQKAVLEFRDAHPELKDKKYAGPAIAAGLLDEYRDDLRKAMLAEGVDPDQVEEDLRAANNEQIARAHQARRVTRDPNVRAIDRNFVEAAYKRVNSEFGSSAGKTEQGLREERSARKDAMRTQPKTRSSVPPAHRGQQQQPADPVSVRKAAVRQMQGSRGQKSR